MITLRPYQQKILTEVRAELRQHRSCLICAPPGSGKGSLIAYMVHGAVSKGKRVIFAVRGRALVHDMSERVTKLGVEHGVLMGGKRREHWKPVQVASIDTLHRMDPMPKCDLLILDEARGFICASGRKVIKQFPETTKIVGADGTPALIDGTGLGTSVGGIFDAMVHGPNEQELIDLGFLVPCIPIGISKPPDVGKIEKTAGDFNQKQLAAVCDKVTLVGDLVKNWGTHAKGIKTVAFGVDQNHARHITEAFRGAGIEWEYVDASTSDDERAKIWHRLDHGTLLGFSNVAIAGVGFDHSILSCVLCARPTASLPLWRQMICRADRPHPGKAFWILLDHAGNLTRPGLWPYSFLETPPIWTLEGTKNAKERGAEDPKPPQVAMCKTPVLIPETGIPSYFTGPVSPDGLYMLPSYHCFRAGPDVCPYCGIPLPVNVRSVEVQEGNLESMAAVLDAAKQEVKVKSAVQMANEAKLRTSYLELARVAATSLKRDGTPYSKNWSAVQFKNLHHRWPSGEWKKEAEELYGELRPTSGQEELYA